MLIISNVLTIELQFPRSSKVIYLQGHELLPLGWGSGKPSTEVRWSEDKQRSFAHLHAYKLRPRHQLVLLESNSDPVKESAVSFRWDVSKMGFSFCLVFICFVILFS